MTNEPISSYTLSLEERATCPRSCSLWRECYGNAVPLAVRFKYDADLISALQIELAQKQREHPAGFVIRLHVLGDFPDVAWVEQWDTWLRQFQALRVWGYTAHNPTSEIGRHVLAMNAIYAGRWAFRTSEAPGAPVRPMQVTTTWTKPERNHAEGGIVCPAETGAVAGCGACGMCWEPAHADTRVVFMGHGRRKRGDGARGTEGALTVAAQRQIDIAPSEPPVTTVAVAPTAAAATGSSWAAVIRTLQAEEQRLLETLTAIRTVIKAYATGARP